MCQHVGVGPPHTLATPLVLLVSYIGLVQASKLNVPRVLLPYSSTPPSFALVAESGCYRWSSTRPDVAKVTSEEGGDCSSSALIQHVGTSGSKASAMVMAEDVSTGLVLRADVIVDKIHELKIVTKTHELYLEETPEKFEVRAYDEQGNEFSTLKGIKFRWTIASGGAAKTDILRFMSWRASPYNTEPILEQLEGLGSQGNKVLLEGVKTGSAKVSVRLADPQYTSVPPATEPLLVVANLFLLPPIAYLLPCASLSYTASQFRGNRMLPVSLPSPHHRLVLPTDLGKVDEETAVLTAARTPGSGQLDLVDQNVEPGEEVKTPSAEVYVVLPSRLELSCLPHKSWAVTVGSEVILQVEIFDVDGNKIQSSDNIMINIKIDESKFEVTSRVSNGTLTVGTPLHPGNCVVTASLVGVQGCPLDAPLATSAMLEIYPSLQLTPSITLLPWDPVSSSIYSVRHTLTGGESPFTWASSNTSLASVSQLGVSSVQGVIIGSSTITVAMSRAPHCQASAEVRVQPAAILELLESEQEFPISSPLSVSVYLAASVSLPFSVCSSLPLVASHSSPSFTSSLLPPTASSHCATLQVTSEIPSHSSLELSWTYPGDLGDVTLTASRTVASYAPLVAHSPPTGETVLAEGTGRQIAWVGGPLPWVLLPSSHKKEVKVEHPEILSVKPLPHSSLHRYSITCTGRGDTTITLTVGNSPSATLPRPVQTQSTIKVSCSVPHSISLRPAIQRPNDSRLPACPLQASQGRLATQAYLPLTIDVTIRDVKERVIDSVSGVGVTWELSAPDLGSLQVQDSIIAQGEERDGVIQCGQARQVLHVVGNTGHLDVTASIVREGGLLGSSTHSDTAKLELVEDTVLEPAQLQLFELEVGRSVSRQGSGYFHLLPPRGEVGAEYDTREGALLVTPQGSGSSSLVLADLCLTARGEGATLSVHVSGLATLLLLVPDKVEISSTIPASLTLLDSTDSLLPVSALQHISLALISETSHVTVGEGKGTEFEVLGAQLGLATLVARAQYGDRVVTSSPASVTVYPPLKLEPRNISLIIGATFQFLSSGGPADCTIVYSIGDINIASTNTDGVVTAATIGPTSLTARAVGRDGAVYSTDTVEVHVRPMTSLRLVLPTRRVLQGSLVPIHIYGQDDDMSVYSYGSAAPLLNMDWTVTGAGSNKDLESPLSDTGHMMVSDNNGVVVFRANTLGKSTVSVTVSISQKIAQSGQYQLEKDRSLTATTSITVVERLEILDLEPRMVAGGILMAPSSTYQFRPNKAAIFSTSSNLITVTKKGLVTSTAHLGSAVVRAVYKEGDREEELAITVEVREVSYLLGRGAGQGWVGVGMETLPRGTNTLLGLTQHDTWGRVFHSQVVDIATRPNRFDLLKVVPSLSANVPGLEARAASKGWSVVRMETVGRENWVVARVGDGLMGASSLFLGDVMQFSSPISSNGEWSVEPAGILTMDTSSGLAVAVGIGQTNVQYKVGDRSLLSKMVTVTRDDGVSLRSPVSSLTDGKRSTVGLVLGSGKGNQIGNLKGLTPSSEELYTCQAEWDGGVPGLEQVWKVEPVWEEGGWACVFTPRKETGPTQPRGVKLTVKDTVLDVSYLPSISLAQDKIEVGVDGGEVRVVGHMSLLGDLSITHSDGVNIGDKLLSDGEVIVPVKLLSHHAGPHTVTVSVPTTGQTVTASLFPLVSSCPDREYTGIVSAILSDLLLYYQSVLVIVLAALLAGYFTFKNLKPAPATCTPAPKPVPATPNIQKPEEVGGTYLWTQDKSPIYGSPIFRRSPPTGARNLTQYSYN